MEAVLFIKRNLQLITEDNQRREFFRFFQDQGNSKLMEIVQDSKMSKVLNENFVNQVREDKRFLSQSNYQRIFEFASLIYKKWNKKELKVFYSGMPAEYASNLSNAFAEWGKYSGIGFIIAGDINDSDIRISFERNGGHWSYIGREAENSSLSGQPTMNFDPANLEILDQKKIYGIFLHEIGHSLGLIHEHQKDTSPINWNKQNVYRDCHNWYGWNKDKVDLNIFNSYNSNELFYSKEFDVESIMIYSIPVGWSSNYEIKEMNTELSELDKIFIEAFYSV